MDWSCHLKPSVALVMRAFHNQMTDELPQRTRRLLYLLHQYRSIRLGINTVLLRYIFKKKKKKDVIVCTDQPVLGNGDISVSPLWPVTACLTDLQPEWLQWCKMLHGGPPVKRLLKSHHWKTKSAPFHDPSFSLTVLSETHRMQRPQHLLVIVTVN